MPIFDSWERTDIEPAGRLVGGFEYLNASARMEAACVRGLLEDMMVRYPRSHRAELTNRIRSRDERLHRSAVFELVLHHLLLRQNFEIITVEPRTENGRAPDFLVASPDGSRFYLEATIAWGDAAPDRGEDRRTRDILQAIDAVSSPDFFLDVHRRGAPRRPVQVSRLRQDIQAFVDGLEHEALVEAIENGRPTAHFQADLEGLHLRVDVIPKNARGTQGRAIGVEWLPSGLVAPH